MSSRCWAATWLLGVSTATALACDPSFTPAAPVLGSIAYEWQAPVPADGTQVQLPGFPIQVPAGAVPPGTVLTVRVTAGADKANPPGWPPNPHLTGNVLQILPASVVFAHPLLATAVASGPAGGLGGLGVPIEHVFRADYGDTAWTWSADKQGQNVPGGGTITWALDRPGLWIWGPPPTTTIGGTYKLTGLFCGSGATSTPDGVYLTVAGGRYSLTAALAPGCHDEGAFSASSSSLSLETGGRTVAFDSQSSSSHLRLKSGGAFLGLCSAQDSLVLFFDLKGCSTDADCGAGGVCGGQLCGPAPATGTTSCLADIVSAPPGGGGK